MINEVKYSNKHEGEKSRGAYRHPWLAKMEGSVMKKIKIYTLARYQVRY